VKSSAVSFHGDFGPQGMKGCLCYVAVADTVPRRKSLQVKERAATNSHLDAFPIFIKAAYFFFRHVSKITKKRLLASSCLSLCPSVRMEEFGFNLTYFQEI